MAAPNGSRLTMSWFCSKVCSFVRFSSDHEAIAAELTSHMEDHRAALLEVNPQMPLWDAETAVVRAMGDPEELGRALNESHSPLLGWFQIWFRRAVLTLAALTLLCSLPQAGRIVSAITAPPDYSGLGMGYLMEHYDSYDVVADFTPDTVWQWNGYTFSIQRAVVTRTESDVYIGEALHLSFLMKVTHADPWQRGPEFRQWLWAEDDLGNRYPSRGQQELSQSSPAAGDSAGNPTVYYPFVSYYDLWVTGIDPEAASLTLRFDRYGETAIYLTLPLKGGASSG